MVGSYVSRWRHNTVRAVGKAVAEFTLDEEALPRVHTAGQRGSTAVDGVDQPWPAPLVSRRRTATPNGPRPVNTGERRPAGACAVPMGQKAGT